MKEWSYYVYILRCADDSFYTGITNDLERRMHEHNHGGKETSYTRGRRPVRLVYSVAFRYVLDAIAWETHVKRWGHRKKEALIRGAIDALHVLAECRNASHSKNKEQDQKNNAVSPSGDED